jgi:hypothetical protein
MIRLGVCEAGRRIVKDSITLECQPALVGARIALARSRAISPHQSFGDAVLVGAGPSSNPSHPLDELFVIHAIAVGEREELELVAVGSDQNRDIGGVASIDRDERPLWDQIIVDTWLPGHHAIVESHAQRRSCLRLHESSDGKLRA